MKNVLKSAGICGLAAVMLLAGCSKKEETTTNTSNVKLGNYKGVEYTPVSTEVTDEDVENSIQNLLSSNPVFTEVDRAAQEGDTVNIDYVGMKDGVAFDGGTAEGYDLKLGSGSFIDGFEDGLIGAVTGQELSLNLTFPEDYMNADLAGQAVVFDVTVNAVKEETEAVLDDTFIQEHTDSQTVEEYREATRKNLEESAKLSAENQKKEEVFMKVMDASEITVSDEEVNQYYEEQLANYESQAAMFGMDLETMTSAMGTTLEEFQEMLKEMAKEAARQNAVVEAIAEAEGFTVSDEDRTALASEMGFASVDDMITNAGQDTVDSYILTDRVVTFIADHAVEAQ